MNKYKDESTLIWCVLVPLAVASPFIIILIIEIIMFAKR